MQRNILWINKSIECIPTKYFFYVHHVTIFKERMHSARLFFTLNCNIQGRSVSLYHLSMTSPGKPPVIGLNLHARGIRSDRRTRNRRRISFENRPSRAPGLSRTMASPRLNLAVQQVSPPLARDMRRRNPWQEVAGSSCPPGGAWITGKVDASCRGRVEGDSCQVAQLYGVCRWYVGVPTYGISYASYTSACRDTDTTRTCRSQWRAR